jgi:hypothetical protein
MAISIDLSGLILLENQIQALAGNGVKAGNAALTVTFSALPPGGGAAPTITSITPQALLGRIAALHQLAQTIPQ